MGSVYRATDLNLGVEVAVKENQYLSAEFSRQFQREASVLANLRHLNLPRVSDYFTIQGQGQYLIMDYIEGEDLRQRIERCGPLPEKEVVLIGAEICDALDYLHNRPSPIVHRDIKPGNIKITPESKVYLVDFGLVKVMHGHQETSTGARAMTPGYSSPEQYGTARTDPRSDIYSLGATLYASLTAEIPEDSLARLTGKTKLTPITKLNPRVSKKVAAAVEKALELEPEKRFQTAAEFKKALREAANLTIKEFKQLTISPPPPKTGEDAAASKTADGNKVANDDRKGKDTKGRSGCATFFLLLLFILIVGAAATIFLKLNWLDAAAPLWEKYISPKLLFAVVTPAQIDTTTPVYTPSPTDSTTSTLTFTATPRATKTAAATSTVAAMIETTTPPATATMTVAITPEPTSNALGGGNGQVAFASNRTGSVQIWSMDVDGSHLMQLTNLSDGACQPAWSPNGKQIAFVSPCRGEHDVYAGSSIYIMDADGSNIHPLGVSPDPAGDFDPTWSPDGQRIAFTSLRSGVQRIYVYNLTTSTLSQITKGSNFEDGQPAWSPSGTQLAFVRTSIFSQIWVVTDDGQTQQQFTLSGPVNDFYPVWSPDGQSIYYCQTSPDTYLPWLMRLRYVDRSTSNENRVPPAGQPNVIPIVDPQISPDGSWIIYEGWPDGTNHDVYLMKINGSDVQRLTSDPGFDFDPA
ncbi:MAG TPA: protein kinase, partial [Longilinea sp.]|nr:protein kinase [Longilinea sp.]